MRFAMSGRILLISVFLLLFVTGTPKGWAQQREVVKIRSVKATLTKTPDYKMRESSQLRLRDWLQIVTEYETQPEWLDELELNHYVLLKNGKDSKEPFVLLQGSITFVHIEKGRKLVSVMYVHPSILARFGSLDSVVVEAKQTGRPSSVDGQGNWQQWQKWIQQLTPKAGYVLRPDQTPFAVLAADDYEMVRPVNR